jgi:hypothetical protein
LHQRYLFRFQGGSYDRSSAACSADLRPFRRRLRLPSIRVAPARRSPRIPYTKALQGLRIRRGFPVPLVQSHTFQGRFTRRHRRARRAHRSAQDLWLGCHRKSQNGCNQHAHRGVTKRRSVPTLAALFFCHLQIKTPLS